MNNYPTQIDHRVELARLFDTPNYHHKLKWGRLFERPMTVIEKEFSNLVDATQFAQHNIAENSFGWYDQSTGKLECMFSIIKNAMDLTSIGEIFELVKEFDPFFTYAIVHQVKDGEGCYDIFRFSRFSYLEHHNRVYSSSH